MIDDVFTVLKIVYLDPYKHQNTGNVRVDGSIADDLPERLEICIYKNIPDAFYLLRLEPKEKTDDSTADSWHPTLRNALEQAEYEFNVQTNDWVDYQDNIRKEK
jgi:hypothetical protein